MRPPKAPEDRLTVKIYGSFTPGEAKGIKDKAREVFLTPSHFVRQATLEKLKRNHLVK